LTSPAGNELLEIRAGSGTPTLTTAVPVSQSILGFRNFSSTVIVGPGGTLYFAEATVNASGVVTASGIGSYNPSTGAWSQVVLPTSGGGQEVFGLAMSGSNLWFTAAIQTGPSAYGASYVGEINTSNMTLAAVVPTTSGSGTTAQPNANGIAVGPNGAIWVTETAAGKIGVINPSNDQLASFSVPTGVVANPQPAGIIAGSGGLLWFADQSGAIGSVDSQLATQLVVTTQPPASVHTGAGFSITVTGEYLSGAVNTGFTGSVTVTIGNNPGGSTLGGHVTMTASQGVATFSGLTLNFAGNGYTLNVSSNGVLGGTTQSFNAIGTPPPPPPPPPSPPSIVGEQAVFFQRTNKKGKPVGKRTLTGYTISYSTAMDPASTANPGNYALAWTSTKRVKKKTVSVLHPIAVSATYSSSKDSVTLTMGSKQKFKKGGQLVITASSPGGVESSAGAFLDGGTNAVFLILPGGIGFSRIS
jgi:hypothetical protein